MANYYVIDAHLHTYKTPEIGRQALSGFNAVGCCGTPEELVPIMEKAGISLAVQVNMTPARSMSRIIANLTPANDFFLMTWLSSGFGVFVIRTQGNRKSSTSFNLLKKRSFSLIMPGAFS